MKSYKFQLLLNCFHKAIWQTEIVQELVIFFADVVVNSFMWENALAMFIRAKYQTNVSRRHQLVRRCGLSHCKNSIFRGI